ncbi:MAG: hypothetical protein FJY17_09545 [Bacteroidetes bacterium]|nr:hypothetical protein [Bacteroidota bacterium]MBM3419144.1 hypothetical protein [Bacteroidota bacterium]
MLKLFLYLLLFSLFACNNSKEESPNSVKPNSTTTPPISKDLTHLLSRVKQFEDSITSEISKNQNKPIRAVTFFELINRLKEVVTYFPKAPETADCLFKLHIKLGEMKDYSESIAYGDTLLLRFPEFKDRDFVLQSIATTYDIYLRPRNSEKVRYYLNQLLLSKNLKEAEKKDLKDRLNYIHLDIIAYSTRLNKNNLAR